MKIQGCFLLNIKHGASQLYLGGLQLSSVGTAQIKFCDNEMRLSSGTQKPFSRWWKFVLGNWPFPQCTLR